MSGVATAIGASALIGAGTTIAMSGKGGKMVAPGYQKLPQYSFTEPNLRMVSDFAGENMQRMSQGMLPQYYDKARPMIRAGMSDPLRDRTFGTGGMQGQGIMDQVRSQGAATGIGPKATMAQQNKALVDYAAAEKQIDQYLAQMDVNTMQRDSQFFPTLMSSMPQGPEVMTWGPTGVGSGGGNTGGAMSSLASGLGSYLGSRDPNAGTQNTPQAAAYQGDYGYGGYGSGLMGQGAASVNPYAANFQPSYDLYAPGSAAVPLGPAF